MNKPKLMDQVRSVACLRHLSLRTEEVYSDRKPEQDGLFSAVEEVVASTRFLLPANPGRSAAWATCEAERESESLPGRYQTWRDYAIDEFSMRAALFQLWVREWSCSPFIFSPPSL